MQARNTILSAILFWLVTSHDPAVAAEPTAHPIAIGERVSLYSDTLAEDRSLLIGKPDGYDDSDDTYPVLIVLDGDAHFHQTTAIARFLADHELMPGVVVVAIENTIRPRDLTPPSSDPLDRQNFPLRGGADAFQTFIADELLPWLDENYRTRPFRILTGHSHGGLFAIYSLITQPGIFDGYIAISPSLQWDGQGYVERADAFFRSIDELPVSLFVTAGNEGGELLGGVRKLAAALDAGAPRGLAWSFEHLPQESHGSIPLRGTLQGLEFIFSDWTLRRDPMEVYDRFGIEAIERFYENSDRRYGYDRGRPVFEVTRIALALMDQGRLDEVMSLIRRYRDAIDPPVRVLVRIADAYRAQDRPDAAAEVYRLALEANVRDTRDDSAADAARQALVELGDERLSAPDRPGFRPLSRPNSSN